MKRTRWIIPVTIGLALMWTSGLRAGDLTPPGAPGATMHTLEEIYQRIGDLEARLDAAGIDGAPAGMVLIPAGDFVMGDTFSEGSSDEQPLHTNTISAFSGGCNWNANGYRLPTEAEWEKAARGGMSGQRFPWAEVQSIQHARANYSAVLAYSYDTSLTAGTHPDFSSGGSPYTSPAGYFAPNGYGLYDMAGNVAEWCWDWYDSAYYASSPATDPRGPASGSYRIVRSSDWGAYPYAARVAYRTYKTPATENQYVGFRLVRATP